MDDEQIDLNEHLIKNPVATFFVRVEGDSMVGRGIYPDDLLIVDRSVKPQHDCVVVAAIHGELTCKILDVKNRCLLPANKKYPPIPVTDDSGFTVEGVVTASVRNQLLQT